MHRHGQGAFDSEAMAAALEVEAELASGLMSDAIAGCAALLAGAGHQVRRVADLGCGPGVATTLLARAFPEATVLAVDGSRLMLDRAARRAERLGLGDRVETLELDLDGDLQAVGRRDLLWAAMAVHHAHDEVATLTGIRSLLAPGGLACLLERADPPSVRLARDLGRPGIWDRLHGARSAWFARIRDTLPGAAGVDAYPSMLAAAGLEVVTVRRLEQTVRGPHDAAGHGWVARELARSVRDLAGIAEPGDVEALRACVETASSLDDAAVTSSRRLFIARPAPAP